MPDDGLRKGQTMYHTCKGPTCIEIKPVFCSTLLVCLLANDNISERVPTSMLTYTKLRQVSSPLNLLPSAKLHGVTDQKTVILLLIAVKQTRQAPTIEHEGKGQISILR
jgi:hypothetical protein